MADWQPIETCPQDGETYVLLRFPEGCSLDRECPYVAVGKRYAMRDNYWLTSIWAGCMAQSAPDAWMPLPELQPAFPEQLTGKPATVTV